MKALNVSDEHHKLIGFLIAQNLLQYVFSQNNDCFVMTYMCHLDITFGVKISIISICSVALITIMDKQSKAEWILVHNAYVDGRYDKHNSTLLVIFLKN